MLLECAAPHWIDVSIALAQHDVKIVYWTAWNKRRCAAVVVKMPESATYQLS